MKRNILTDEIYKKLLEEIVKLEIMPGTKLSENLISKKYGVSRAPIRKVISKLESEDLLVVKPQIGTFVKPILYKDIKNICDIRILLEPYATEKAAENIKSNEIDLLKKHYDRIINFKGNIEEKNNLLFEIDLLLHRTIWRLCGNDEIFIIIESYRNKIDRARLMTAKFAKRLEPSIEETFQIFEGLLSKKPKNASNAMYNHLFNFKKAILYLIEEMVSKINNESML